jgi:Metal binding domain of Ada
VELPSRKVCYRALQSRDARFDGLIFVGVSSTRVYCRPICPTRTPTFDRQELFNQAMARALKPIDSYANFVMLNAFHPAQEVIEHFRKNNILIGCHFPPMDTYIRVS